MKRLRAAGAALFIMALVHAPVAGGAETAQQAFKDSSRALDLQTRLPEQAIKIEPENDRPRTYSEPFLSAGAAKVLLWTAVAGIIAVILLHLRNNLWSASRARRLMRAEEEEIAPVATAARMEQAQREADDLAHEGDFAEAMHLLLLQSLSEMRRRLDVSIAVSLTSREILHAIGLPPRAEDAFADIIGRVEVSYFGGRQPSAEEYSACRRSFEALRKALGGGEGA